MTDLDFVKVVGRFGITVADSADDGDEPDIIWCDSGEILLHPLITEVKVAGSPIPWTGGQADYQTTIDAEGYVAWRGQRYVKVVDLTSEKVNPRIVDGKATHQVTFKNVTAGEMSVLFEPRNVRLSADMVNPDTGVCDLTLLLPVPIASAVPIVVGPSGTGLTGGVVQESPTSVAFELTNGGTTDEIELPVGPGGSDVGVAGYLDDEDSDTRAVLDPLVTAKVQEVASGFGTDLAAYVATLPAGALYSYTLVSAAGDLLDIYTGKKA
jgi:hypothetical protein